MPLIGRNEVGPGDAVHHTSHTAVTTRDLRGRRDEIPTRSTRRTTAGFDERDEPIFVMMVTGEDPSRALLAQVAVDSFAAQDHANRVLVLIASGDCTVDVSAIPEEHRIVIPSPQRLPSGERRNLGLDVIPVGALWAIWDHGWHHPRRLSAQRQVLDVLGVSTCLLTRQVMYSRASDTAHVRRSPDGLPTTLLSRRHLTLRFPPETAGADAAYVRSLTQQRSWYPWANPPHLTVRFAQRTDTRDTVGCVGAPQRSPGTWALPPRSAKVLHEVLYRRPEARHPDPSDVDGPRAVVLSTGRAGSRYIADLLTEAGIACGHEAVFHFERRPGAGLLVDSSWLALPYVEAGEFHGRVFHQVRHPLKVLASLLNGQMQANVGRRYAHFQQAHLHGSYPNDGDFVHFAVRFVVDWNRRCEQVAERTWRVEDVDLEIIRAVAAAVDRPVSDRRAERALRAVSRTTNKHPPGPRLTWDDLGHVGGAEELRRQARRYGYV